MSYIGRIGAERLDGSNPALGLIAAQKDAVSLLRSHTDMRHIKEGTGWELGGDGKWRYEISDPFHTTAEIEDHFKKHFGEVLNIRYCMRDTTLLTAYPAFERLRLFAMYNPVKNIAGYFSPSNYGMMICMGTASSPFEFQSEGILLHEVQHLIQEEENFARGGSGSGSRYWRLAGEVEARNVCIRHSLTEEQRRTKLRTETQDVPDVEQIVRFR